ncbi:MAG: ATPase [Oscillospiraceae bacterium]|nr:ATPase [Oscillospiraceae bacterium]
MENSYSIEELIELLEDLINESTRVPFNKKSMVDVDKMSEILQDMRMALPMEIQQAQRVVMDKNSIISEAKREAESIIRKAEQRRAELLEESDIVKEARRRATEMVSAEQNHCTDLRTSTNEYVDKMLQRIEELLANDLNHLKILRGSINGAQNSLQSSQPTMQPMEKPGE